MSYNHRFIFDYSKNNLVQPAQFYRMYRYTERRILCPMV
jgi:hypothetical protein